MLLPIIVITHQRVVSQPDVAIDHLRGAIYCIVRDGITIAVDVKREQIARGIVVDGHVIHLQEVVGIVDHPAIIGVIAFHDFVACIGDDLAERGR